MPPKPNTNQEISLTRTEMSDKKAKSKPSRIPIKSSGAQSTPTTSPRIRFDQYDCHRWFASRQDLTKTPYYAYLEQQATTLPSVDTKGATLRNIYHGTETSKFNKLCCKFKPNTGKKELEKPFSSSSE